jgi:hypothetical protein
MSELYKPAIKRNPKNARLANIPPKIESILRKHTRTAIHKTTDQIKPIVISKTEREHEYIFHLWHDYGNRKSNENYNHYYNLLKKYIDNREYGGFMKTIINHFKISNTQFSELVEKWVIKISIDIDPPEFIEPKELKEIEPKILSDSVVEYEPKILSDAALIELQELKKLMIGTKISPADYVRKILNDPVYINNLSRLAYDHPLIFKMLKEKGMEAYVLGDITTEEFQKVQGISDIAAKPYIIDDKYKVDTVKFKISQNKKPIIKTLKKYK